LAESLATARNNTSNEPVEIATALSFVALGGDGAVRCV
jgi:hypothetical protein